MKLEIIGCGGNSIAVMASRGYVTGDVHVYEVEEGKYSVKELRADSKNSGARGSRLRAN